jgi:hypothetical protein
MKNLLQIITTIITDWTCRIAEEIGNTSMVNCWNSYITLDCGLVNSNSNLFKIGPGLDVYLLGTYVRLTDKDGSWSRNTTRYFIKQVIQIEF